MQKCSDRQNHFNRKMRATVRTVFSGPNEVKNGSLSVGVRQSTARKCVDYLQTQSAARRHRAYREPYQRRERESRGPDISRYHWHWQSVAELSARDDYANGRQRKTDGSAQNQQQYRFAEYQSEDRTTRETERFQHRHLTDSFADSLCHDVASQKR